VELDNRSADPKADRLFFDDPVLAVTCATQPADIDAGHGRIKERLCRVADAGWLVERHPKWMGLRSLAAITERHVDKESGKESLETRFFVASIEPDPNAILHAVRSHWGIENNLHWTLDVIFDEDRCKTRKDNAPLGHAIIRHTALNILKADRLKGSLRRKRIRAWVPMNPAPPGCGSTGPRTPPCRP
jgi:predicted transposase YbfD/YdcC